MIPDGISSPVASFESSENASFINQNGTKTSISGCYKLLATRLETFPYADIIEYGFLVSTVSGGYKKVKSEIPLTASGAYGVLFYGFNKGETYFFYPYAVYQLHGGESETITGEQYVFICE